VLFKKIEDHFRDVFRDDPDVVACAPGRVNLIGEHTDYNEGFVLPAAIDRYVCYAGRRRTDRKVRAFSVDFQDWTQFDLDDLRRDEGHSWSNYLRGVSELLEAGGAKLPGADLAIAGDVPREAGLSSSAAVEVAAVAFWQRLGHLEIDPVSVIKLAQKAENEFVGVPCGIMDQFISALGRKDHALFLDCRDLTYRHVPLQPGVKIVVCNSGVKRALAQSEYERRRNQCTEALAMLRSTGLAVNSLRDVELAELEAARHVLTEVLFKRARHVITENQRVLEAVLALEESDLDQFGTLMNQSHTSLRDDYEVSSPELDLLVNLASEQRGVLGARMTGAGFGGCTVNLVRQDSIDSFVGAISQGYELAQGMKAEVYVLQASDGALSAAR
jgi:galactokinase